MTGETEAESQRRSTCKLDKIIDKYGLVDLNAELRYQRNEEETSLRDLAEYVNIQIVDATLESVDATVAGDAVSVHRALTAEDVRPERRMAVRNQLTDLGLNLDELTTDFISYQTVRTHLRRCLGLDTGRRGITSLDEGYGVIQKARDRTAHIVERTLTRLARVGALAAGDVTVSVSIRVTCETCDVSVPVEDFLDRDGCECAPESDAAE